MEEKVLLKKLEGLKKYIEICDQDDTYLNLGISNTVFILQYLVLKHLLKEGIVFGGRLTGELATIRIPRDFMKFLGCYYSTSENINGYKVDEYYPFVNVAVILEQEGLVEYGFEDFIESVESELRKISEEDDFDISSFYPMNLGIKD